MEIVRVSTRKEAGQFLKVPSTIYANDASWVSPLFSQIESVFDRNKNPAFKTGDACRWIASTGNTLQGRIAAFYRKTSDKNIACGIGFFESVDSEEVAGHLFSTAIEWLSSFGCRSAQAPINFGENDRFWGLLIEGFEMPSFGMNYHPPYYQRLFERAGFVKDYDQLTNILDIVKPFPERFRRIAGWVAGKKGYSFKHLELNKFDKYAEDFMEVYNDAWKDFNQFKPLDKETVLETFRQMRPIVDENLIIFAYYNDKPVSFVLVIPDANIWFKPLNGNLNVLNKLRFIFLRKVVKATRLRAIVMGTKSAFQNLGIESALFIKLGQYVLPLKQYKELELSWVGDFNEKMIALHMAMEPFKSRRHRTYKIEF